jgi:HPt (histidine-containing phosphotransfer) domain-containing protein
MDDYASKPLQPAMLRRILAEVSGGAAGEAPSTPPRVDEVIDQEVLLECIGGDRAFLSGMIERLMAVAPEQLAFARSALAEGDAARLEKEVHRLRGALANFQARGAVDAAGRLEEIAASGDLQAAPEALARTEAEVQRVLEVLPTLLRE